jgi:phosphoserine phosphatase
MPEEVLSKKEELEQLKDAEKKYQAYISRRNELNDMAKVVREERDMINESRKKLKEEMDKVKKERDELVSKMRHHKEIRNKLQEQAKQLIEAKRKKKGEVFRNLPLRVEELKADFQMLEYRQETVPMSSAKENALIEKIREKRTEYERTKTLMDKQKTVEIDITDKDKAIDELFKKADEEHKLVQKYYDENQKKHEKFVKLVNELSVMIGEANKKHAQFVENKNEANAVHDKAFEMKSKIITIKSERRKRRDDARKAIQDQNVMARRAVMDKKTLEKIADDAVDELKKGKKITLKS